MLEYFNDHPIAVNGTIIRFNPGSEIDALLDTFLDQLPEQPINYTKNSGEDDKEKYERKYRLLNRVERMLKPDQINEIIDMNEGPAQELLISLYTLDQDVFAGNLVPFLRSVTMQNQAYFEGKRDEKPGPWHAPAPMVAHYHARQAREAAASNGNGHSANGTEELAESVSVFTLPIEHRSTPKKVTAQR